LGNLGLRTGLGFWLSGFDCDIDWDEQKESTQEKIQNKEKNEKTDCKNEQMRRWKRCTTTISMADKEDRNQENVVGKFYVDSSCIDCDLCRETAPQNFTRSDDEGYSFVYKQPTTPEEEEQCREAMEGCPVEAIGDDGE
jgi:ferredoxin